MPKVAQDECRRPDHESRETPRPLGIAHTSSGFEFARDDADGECPESVRISCKE
jgi:hypothetical protein